MASPTQTSVNFSDRPLNNKLISELRSIADLMGVDGHATLRKPELVKAIQRHMKETPGIADDPHFLPLFAHRTAPTAGGKNSAEKSTEDEIESSKPQLAATGANKTLLAQNVKLDPPAQFAKLSLGKKQGEALSRAEVVGEDDSDLSEDEGVRHDTATTPEPDSKVETIENKEEKSGVVQVNFFDEHDGTAPPRPVLVDDFPVVVSTAPDGTQKFTTLLSELIPAAISNDSPIKERGGRLYRPNIRDEPGHHHLGKIEALMTGTSTALKPQQMNEYALRTSDDGLLICDIFWDRSAQAVGGVPSSATHPIIPDDTKNDGLEIPDDVKPKPLKFTGAGTDVPLEIASDRAMNNPMHKNATPGLRGDFARFIHETVRAEVPDIPEYGADWPRCVFAGQLLDRKLHQDAIFTVLGKWGRTRGGYLVPKGFGEFAGVKFDKKFAYDALKLGSSSATDLEKYLGPAAIENAPKVQEWLESKGKTHDSKFRKMKTARFKEYIKEDHTKSRREVGGSRRADTSSRRVRHRSHSLSDSGAPARKHRKQASVSPAEDNSDNRVTKKASKGKGKKVESSSEDIDG
ncbi:hypothetical protein B0H11DRAFT_2224523 [Mycena galericulata]|nr:hypothetical protein B0H11DRAFT_2224523 [Mycena galericulata]